MQNHDELIAAVRALYEQIDETLRAKFDRSLPFQDAVFDRWERAQRLGFAEGASVYNSALVFGSVSVGAHTWVGPYSLLDGSGGALMIGEYCSISAGVHIYTHDTVQWALSGGTAAKKTGPVSIGDRCYIGPHSIISSGVEIGAQCVVGANSFVNKSVEPRTIVAGTPARRIGCVTGEGINVSLHFDERS